MNKKVYKYSRKEFLKKVGFLFSKGKILVPNEVDGEELMKLLLAKKEDKKECKHEGDKTDWHPQFCRKCGAEFMYDFSTPSPLNEIKELREVKFGMDSNQTFENFYDAINSLIRNQKKLYQLIKEKL